MSKVFGLACHAPEELIPVLVKAELKPNFFVLPYGSLLINTPIPTKAKNILILTAQDFTKNWRFLNSDTIRNKNIFVFAGHTVLLEYVGIHRLDMRVSKSKTGRFSFRFLEDIDVDLLLNAKPTPLRRRGQNYVNKLIHDVQLGSLLNDLMTFIYMLPSKTHQKPVRLLSARYLIENWTMKKFMTALDKLATEISITEKMRAKLMPILTCPVADRMRLAFKESTDFERAEEMANKYEISAYELRYLLQSVRNEKAYANNSKTSIDSFLDNKNEPTKPK